MTSSRLIRRLTIIDVFAREQLRLAEQVRSYRQANLDELARLDYESLPDAVVYGDCHAGNIFFHRRRLTAMLDFDLVHRDVRAVDIALAIALDCTESPAHTSIRPGVSPGLRRCVPH